MVPWQWSDEMGRLEEACMEWFVANFAEGQHGSLQILGQDASGATSMLKVNADDDDVMFESCRANVRQMGFVRFLGLGEGQLQAANGPVDVFIMHFQDTSDDRVRSALAPYSVTDEGYDVSPWQETEWLDESWLAQS